MGEASYTLGEIIAKYREKHNLSERAFAAKCGLSRSYIGFLEKNSHPTTKNAIVPSLKTILAIAKAVEISPNEIMNAIGMDVCIDDADIQVSSEKQTTKPVQQTNFEPFRYIPLTEPNLMAALKENRILLLPFPAPKNNSILYEPSLEYGVVNVHVTQLLGGAFRVSSIVFGDQMFTIFDIGHKVFTERSACDAALKKMQEGSNADSRADREDEFYV